MLRPCDSVVAQGRMQNAQQNTQHEEGNVLASALTPVLEDTAEASESAQRSLFSFFEGQSSRE